MDKFDWFKDKFQLSLSDDEQVDIFNRYCDINNVDEHIYHMSDINEFFKNCTPLEILSSVADCEFNVANEYFAIVRGSIESFSDPYLIIRDYLVDIYKCKEAWEDLIYEREYLEEIYEEYIELKPSDMSLDEYTTLVEEAYKRFEFESDIEEYLNKYMKFSE